MSGPRSMCWTALVREALSMDASTRLPEVLGRRCGGLALPRWVVVASLLVASGHGRSQRNGSNGPTTQSQTPDYSATRPSTNGVGGMPDLGDPASRREMEEKRGNLLNTERQRAMVREAGQLVQLTAELQVTLARDPQGAAREEAVHRVETIERLARNVKERMKGGR